MQAFYAIYVFICCCQPAFLILCLSLGKHLTCEMMVTAEATRAPPPDVLLLRGAGNFFYEYQYSHHHQLAVAFDNNNMSLSSQLANNNVSNETTMTLRAGGEQEQAHGQAG